MYVCYGLYLVVSDSTSTGTVTVLLENRFMYNNTVVPLSCYRSTVHC